MTGEDSLHRNERQIKSQIKIGVGLAAFGIICPLFWLSLFSNGSSHETWVYGLHSCFFILFGLIVLGKGWYDLKSARAGAGLQSPEE